MVVKGCGVCQKDLLFVSSYFCLWVVTVLFISDWAWYFIPLFFCTANFYLHPSDDDRPSTFQINIEIERPPCSTENSFFNRSFSSPNSLLTYNLISIHALRIKRLFTYMSIHAYWCATSYPPATSTQKTSWTSRDFSGADVSAIRGASPFWPHGTAVCAGTLARLAATGGPLAFSHHPPAVVREVLQTKWPKTLVKLELERFCISMCIFLYDSDDFAANYVGLLQGKALDWLFCIYSFVGPFPPMDEIEV